MLRRSFLSMLGMAPAVAAIAAIQPAAASAINQTIDINNGGVRGVYPPGYHRLSIESHDLGYIPYAKFLADHGRPEVLLDGVRQQCITADAKEGWVKRRMMSPGGNAVIAGDEFVMEIAHGRVEIRARRDIATADLSEALKSVLQQMDTNPRQLIEKFKALGRMIP